MEIVVCPDLPATFLIRFSTRGIVSNDSGVKSAFFRKSGKRGLKSF